MKGRRQAAAVQGISQRSASQCEDIIRPYLYVPIFPASRASHAKVAKIRKDGSGKSWRSLREVPEFEPCSGCIDVEIMGTEKEWGLTATGRSDDD